MNHKFVTAVFGVLGLVRANVLAQEDKPPPSKDSVPKAVSVLPKSLRFIEAIKAGKKQTIVVFGTSLSVDKPGGNWPSLLKEHLDKKFPDLVTLHNRAASGRNGGWGLGHVAGVIDCKPDAVFMEFSINDAKDKQMPLDSSRAYLNKTIDALLAAHPNCEIILMTMNPCTGKRVHSQKMSCSWLCN